MIIRKLELDTYKTFQDKSECYGVPSHGEVERGAIVEYWLKTVTWTRVRSYLSLVLVILVSQVKADTSTSENPPPFALIHVHE